jgi:UrcA family protein
MKTPLLFALALAVAAPVAAAAHEDGPMTVEVRYGDLDLNKPDDAAIMLGRLNEAALQACGAAPFESLREYRLTIRHSRCYVRSLSRAVGELNSPTLTAAFDREYRSAG